MNREKQKIAELNEQNKEIYLQTKMFLRRDVKSGASGSPCWIPSSNF